MLSFILEDFYVIGFKNTRSNCEHIWRRKQPASMMNKIKCTVEHCKNAKGFSDISETFLPFDKAIINRLFDQCWKIFGP